MSTVLVLLSLVVGFSLGRHHYKHNKVVVPKMAIYQVERQAYEQKQTVQGYIIVSNKEGFKISTFGKQKGDLQPKK